MNVHPGYEIPENPQPEGYYCLRVYIPRDDSYLYAFSGSFQFFGKWLAWEKDSEHRALLAAAAWRDAIDYTFTNGWLDCGDNVDCCEQIGDIVARLEELENMNISVNCGCGCGCGTSTTQPIPDPPADEQPPYQNPNPVPTPEEGDGLVWKCNMSHYLVYSFRYMAIRATVPGTFPDWSALYDGLFSGFTSLALSFAWYAYTLMVSLLTNRGTDEIVVPIDAAYETLVCSIYSATNDVQAHAQFTAVINQIFPESILRQGLLAIASQTPFRIAFEPLGLENLPITHNNRTCEECSQPTVFPLPPVSETSLFTFECPQSLTEEVSSPHTTDLSIDPGQCSVEYSAAIPENGNTWNPGLECVAETIPSRELIGWAWLIEYLSASGGDPAHAAEMQLQNPPEFGDDEWVIASEVHGYISADYHSEFDTWAGTAHEINPLDVLTTVPFEFYKRAGVGDPAASISVRVQIRFIYREAI